MPQGTILRYQPRKQKKPSFGFSVDLGRKPDGSRNRVVKRGFERESEAIAAMQAAIEEHQHTPTSQQSIPSFSEFFERWYAHAKREWAAKTAERTHELCEYAVRLFGNVPLNELDTMRLDRYMSQLSDHGGRVTKQHPKGRPLAPKTVRHIGFAIQACLEQAVDWSILTINPMKKVRKPKVPKRRPKIVDPAGFNTLLKRLSDSCYYPFIVLASATGMRRGELCALEWTDLNWNTGVLEVSKSLEVTEEFGVRTKGTKSGETRRFAIPAEVLEVLRTHKADQEQQRELFRADYANHGLVFCRPDGEHLNPKSLGSRVNKLIRSAGLPGISLHSLRHSHASQLLSQGAPITAVAARLGHASPNITLGIYAHELPLDNQAAAQLWNNAMGDLIAESRKEHARKRLVSNGIKTTDPRNVIPFKSAS